MNIYQKLVEVRRQVTGLSKDAQTQSAGRFKYVSSNNILGELRPLMDEQGLLLECRVLSHTLLDKWRGASGQNEHMTELEVEFVWVNADNPEEKIVCPFYGQGLDTGEKGVGKALTYAEKYFLLKFFNIPTDEDDPDSGSKPREERTNGHGSARPLETQQDIIDTAQYHPDGTPANAAAEKHAAMKWNLPESAEAKLLTLMDALEMPDEERRAAFATVNGLASGEAVTEAARALKAHLEAELKLKQEAAA